MKTRIVYVMLVAVSVAITSSAERSAPVRLVPDSSSIWWRTCLNGEIKWEWPAGANSAKLSVAGRNGVSETVFGSSVSSCVLPVPADSASEDVCDFTLTFHVSGDATGDAMPGETLTADGVGIVRGVNGAALEVRPVSHGNLAWRKVKGGSAVLPLPADAESLALDGVECAERNFPWVLWSPISAGVGYAWTLSAGDEDFSALLMRYFAGFAISVQ